MELTLGIDPKSYNEFVSAIDEIDRITEQHCMMEAVLDRNPRKGFSNAVKNATHQSVKRTSDTMGTVVKATGTLGKVYGTGWDIMWKLFDLAVDAANFIVENIGRLLTAVVNAGRFVLRIPKSAYNRIKGNLDLYIPVEAIDSFYGNQICQKLHTFLQTMELFSQGDTWGKFVKIMTTRDTKGNVVKEKQTILPQKDIDLAKKMKKIYIELSYMDFKLDTVDMSNATNQQIYFSGEKSIRFVDTLGKEHHLSYFDALKFLLEDLRGCQKQLSELQKAVGGKHQRAQAAGQWVTLPKGHQDLIVEVIEMFSKINSMIGKMTKCITNDMKQLNYALGKIEEKIPEIKNSKPIYDEGVTTDLRNGTMANAAYRQKVSRTFPDDFPCKTWKGVPKDERKAYKQFESIWIGMAKEFKQLNMQNKIETALVYLFVTSDENVRLGVFGYPGKFTLGNNVPSGDPTAFNIQDIPKDQIPPSLTKELKPNEKIFINC